MNEEKLKCVLKLAFNNDWVAFDRFCRIAREGVPEAHAAVLRGSSITGKRHSDPDIAPELVALRRRLMDMVHRPVNIQGTCDWVQFFRGDIMEQPYLALYGSVKEL